MQIRARGIHSFGYHDPNPLVFTPRRGIKANIGSDNGVLPDNTNPLPEGIWLVIIENFWNSVGGSYTGNAHDIYPKYEFEHC